MICFQNQPCMAWLNSFQAVLPGLCNQTTELLTVVRWGGWVSLVFFLSRPITLGNHQTRQSSIKREEGWGWIWGVCYLNLRWERGPRAIYLIFQDDLGPQQYHPFFNMPNKFDEQISKMGCKIFASRSCTSYMDFSQESVYLIAKNKNKKKKVHKVY